MNRQFVAVVAIALLPLLANHALAQPFVDGIDVSHWQGTINWTAVKNDGIDFAFTKATQGNSFVDSRFAANMANATAAGVLIGPYHFADVDTDIGNPLDPVNEANHFLNNIQPYYNTGMYLPPVADVEGFNDLPVSWTIAQRRDFISDWVQDFSDTINNALGVRPLVYSSLWAANNYYTPSVASSHDLWLAWWKGTGTTDPPLASDTPQWNEWKFWQYTATGSVAGISGNVDRDVFNGTPQDLNQLLIGTDSGGGNSVMITDFEADEGYFSWSPSFSGSTTTNIAGSTADRSGAEAHDGGFSQLINITYDEASGTPFMLRHLSGIGSPASPAGNIALDSNGFLGFWLKTDDAGLTVRVAVDDPSPAIDRGIEQALIADGQWHLYQWDLEDDSQWEPWVGTGTDGMITGATVTLDSIQFFGSSDAVIYLDGVAHNPSGSLLPVAGDFDGNGIVDGNDLDNWEAGYGTTSGAGTINGDADDDADVDGRDFLTWQQNLNLGTGSIVGSVPEPAAWVLALAAAGIAAAVDRKRR